MFVRSIIQKIRCGRSCFSFTCVLWIAFLNDINAMSLDRLSINSNDIQQIDKQLQQQQQQQQQQLILQDNNNYNDYNNNKESPLNTKNILIDNTQYLPNDLNDQNHLMLASVNQYNENEDNEDEQTIDSNYLSDTNQLIISDTNNQNDMIMLESQDTPAIVEMLQQPAALKETLPNEMKDKEIIIESDNNQSVTYNNSEQLKNTSEEIEQKIVNELNQENVSLTNDHSQQDGMLQNPLHEKESNENRTPENLLLGELFDGESISTPKIEEMAEDENASDLLNEHFKEDDVSNTKTETPVENNEGVNSVNIFENQFQQNSDRLEISPEVQLLDVNSHEIFKGEDYISNEDDMPEECGDEYYMNPNQETSEHMSDVSSSDAKETVKPFEMELGVIPSEEGSTEIESGGHDLKGNMNPVTNIENDWKVPSPLISLAHIKEMESVTMKEPLVISPETEPAQLMEVPTKPLPTKPNEQVFENDNVNNSELSSELIDPPNPMVNNILTNPLTQIPPRIMDQYPEVLKTSEETLNNESATDILITTIKSVNSNEHENVNNVYSIPSQNITEKEIINPKPTETIFNSQLRRYDGAQVWRIVVQNDKERKLADALNIKFGGQLWKEVKQEVDYLLKPQVLTEAEQYVRAANLSRIVLIDNLQKVIEVENPPAEQIAQLQNRKGYRLTWQAYHRLEDIHGFFDYLAKTYSDICSVEIIGYSIEKRPLKILKISNGQTNNTGIWIDGGIHAREWISPAVVTYIANHLVEGWDDLPAYMRNIDWYIHAVVNPDGYEYSHTTDRLWRKNMRSHGRSCPGVDLNRNFGYMWGGRGTSANPCSQIYRGTKAFSEPEAFYISKFISGFPKGTFKAYLSFHSYGQYILYPWGYDYLETNDTMDLDLLARQAGTSIAKSTGVKYTVGAAANTLYAAAGGSDDWAKGIAEIKYSYTIEMGDTGRYGFVLPASEIECNGKNAYTVVQTISRGIMMGKNGRRRKLKQRHY